FAFDEIEALGSYAEVSPSETGAHAIARGRKPDGDCTKAIEGGKVEIYDSARYFTVTGNHIEGTPREVLNRQQAIDALHAKLFPPEEPEAPAASPAPPPAKDEDFSDLDRFGGDCRPVHSSRVNPWDNSPPLRDDEVIAKASESARGEEFRRLMAG